MRDDVVHAVLHERPRHSEPEAGQRDGADLAPGFPGQDGVQRRAARDRPGDRPDRIEARRERQRAGERPDYHIDPKRLPERDRAALRDAFGVIKSQQAALAQKYQTRAV